MKKWLIPIVIALPAGGIAGESDHEFARRAVEAGEILPLRQILERAEAAYPGQFIEAELEREDGQLVYEIKLVTPQGGVLELYYDARTGSLLKAEDD